MTLAVLLTKTHCISILQSGYKLIRKESEEELSLLRSHDVEEGSSHSDSGHREGDGEEVMLLLNF